MGHLYRPGKLCVFRLNWAALRMSAALIAKLQIVKKDKELSKYFLLLDLL